MIRLAPATLLFALATLGCGSPTPPATQQTPAPTVPVVPDTKLTGTFVCGRCALKVTAKCTNTLQVKEGDRVVNYFLEDKGVKEAYHEEICGDGKLENTTVVGQVTERDGKKFISPSRPVEFVK